MNARPADDRRLDGEDVQRDRRDSSSVSEWFPTASPKTTAAAMSQRSGRRAAAISHASQRASAEQDRGHEGKVERVRVGLRSRCARRPASRGQPEAGGDADAPWIGQPPHEADCDAGGDRHATAPRRCSSGTPARRTARAGVGEPAEQHVGRVAGRMGRAQERQHGLELAGVPEPDPGHAAPMRRRATSAATARRRRGRQRARRVGRRDHHPRSWPQMTPHRLIADATTADQPRGPREPRPDAPARARRMRRARPAAARTARSRC